MTGYKQGHLAIQRETQVMEVIKDYMANPKHNNKVIGLSDVKYALPDMLARDVETTFYDLVQMKVIEIHPAWRMCSPPLYRLVDGKEGKA